MKICLCHKLQSIHCPLRLWLARGITCCSVAQCTHQLFAFMNTRWRLGRIESTFDLVSYFKKIFRMEGSESLKAEWSDTES